MWLRQEIPKPTSVPSVTEPEGFPEIISEPVSPVSFAPKPGSSSGSGETPMAIPPGFGSYPLRDGTAWVMPRGSFPPPPLAQDPPLRFQQANAVNFGGIVKGIAKFVDNKAFGGAIQTIGGMLDKAGMKPQPGMPGYPMPSLPAIGGGLVKGPGPFGDVRAGGSSTAQRYTYGARRKYRRMNPMNVKALRRAVRRLDSGEKLFRKVFSVRHPGHHSITPKRGARRAK